jgi:DNA-binding transcriptional LysR family regulator
LHVSQPTLSQQLKDTLRAPLLDRSLEFGLPG